MRKVDTLDELRADVHRDPRRVAEAASRLVTQARAGDDQPMLSRSLGVLGRARRALGDIALAELDLRGSIEAGRAAADDELVADACVGLAGVLMFAGRSEDAFAELTTADRLGSPRVRAYAALQRAVVAQKIGQVDMALAAYEAALPTLRTLDARVDLAMVLMNRGVIRAQSGDFDDAVADLVEAGEIFQTDGNGYGTAQACHGLGWAYARRGDLVLALEHLDRAAEQFHELGYHGLEIEVDRVECLLAAGLSTAATELGLETASRAAASGDHMHAAQMWLMCARAAFLDGDLASGASHAERARELFAAQGSVVWQHIARLEVVRAGAVDADADELCALAAELGRAGHARGAVTAVALAALAACAAGDVDRAGALAEQCAREADRLGVFEVRVVADHALATCAVARRDRRAARRHVRSGLADLRRHRASFAAADARASVAVHAEKLAALGLRLALESGSASDVLSWMELTRAGRRRHPAARPVADSAGAAELTELRSVAAEVRAHEADGRDTVDLLHRQRDLERAAHRRRLRTSDERADLDRSPLDVTGLRSLLVGQQLVELAGIGERLVGVTLGRRRARLLDLGPIRDVLGPVGTMLTALRTAIAPSQPTARRRAAIDLLGRAADQLDRVLAAVFRGDGPLVLVVPPELHAVPWQLLPTLVGRPIVLAPTATWWGESAADPPFEPGGRTVAVAGPRLVEAEAEARAVAACYPNATVLAGPAATTAAVSAALAVATIAHVASHGRVRRDNPLWSSLELADGPLSVYDLEAMTTTPRTVVLSGCETGVGVQAGDGLLGLSTALLERGTRSLVASVCLLPDSAETRSTMTRLHEQVAAGSVPSAALAGLAAGPRDSDAAMLAACLTCFGAR